MRSCVAVLVAFCAPGASGLWLGGRLGGRAASISRASQQQRGTTRAATSPTSEPPLAPRRAAAARFSSPHLDAVEAAVDATLAAAEASLGAGAGSGAAFPVPKNPSSQASPQRTASAVLGLPEARRESYGAARALRHKLDSLARGGDCRRCWLKPHHCVCAACPPLVLGGAPAAEATGGTQVAQVETTGVPASAAAALLSETPGAVASASAAAAAAAAAAAFPVRRLFVLMHHKEVGLAVDTAKLLLAAYPSVARLAVGGLGGHDAVGASEGVGGGISEGAVSFVGLGSGGVGGGVQPAYLELVRALAFSPQTAVLLFPTHDARPFADVAASRAAADAAAEHAAAAAEAATTGATAASAAPSAAVAAPTGEPRENKKWDVVVVDGTWEQARKLHARLLGHVQAAQQQMQQPHGFQGEAPPPQKVAQVTHVCLSATAVAALGSAAASGGAEHGGGFGRQLRRHPTPWREVSTLEATRRLLLDMGAAPEVVGPLQEWQLRADAAAKKQLGPRRIRAPTTPKSPTSAGAAV